MVAPRRTLLRVLGFGGGALLGLTALVGFAHTSAGRPLLALLGKPMARAGASCPLGYDRAATPAEREAGRRRFSATHGGPAPALQRPALGFVLDGTARKEVEAWAREHAILCAPLHSGELDCRDVPATLLVDTGAGVAARSVRLAFDGAGKLVSVIVVRRDADAASISRAFSAVTSVVASATGTPSRTEGAATPEALRRGALSQASAEYRFSNYYALARATNMGDGFVLTEEYRSLVD